MIPDRQAELDRMHDHDLLVIVATKQEAMDERLRGCDIPRTCERHTQRIRGLVIAVALGGSILLLLMGSVAAKIFGAF